MKIQKLTALLAAIILLTAATAQEDTKEAKKELSNTRIASCLVKITCDPAVLPLSLETIDQLLNSSGVAGKAAREILEIPVFTDEAEEMVQFGIWPLSDELESDFAAEQILFFRLGVELDTGVKPAAEELMKALIDNLHKTLNAAFKDYSKRFRQQLDFAVRDVQRAEAELRNLQRTLRNILGTYNLERQAILDDTSRSRRELRDTEMELETNEAFVQATSKRIAETEKKMMDKLANDPVLSELQKIIKIHEERITKLGNKGAPEPETSEARENLLRARIELAEHREEIRQSAGAELINSLRNQISEVTIQRAQALMRMENFQKQLQEAEHLLEKADDYELVSLKLEIAKQTLEESLLLHSRMQRKGLLISPSVVVFGAE